MTATNKCYNFVGFGYRVPYLAQLLTIMHQLCFLYTLKYPVIYSLSERGSEHARNCVYPSKIEVPS